MQFFICWTRYFWGSVLIYLWCRSRVNSVRIRNPDFYRRTSGSGLLFEVSEPNAFFLYAWPGFSFGSNPIYLWCRSRVNSIRIRNPDFYRRTSWTNSDTDCCSRFQSRMQFFCLLDPVFLEGRIRFISDFGAGWTPSGSATLVSIVGRVERLAGDDAGAAAREANTLWQEA